MYISNSVYVRKETRTDIERLDMSRRDGGLWEDVSGRKHVVVAIYRIRGVEDVDDLFVPRARSAVWLSHGGILGSKESAW